MKIKNVYIHKCNTCGSETLTILVDKIPEASELEFQKHGDLYFAEKNGYVEFYYWNKSDTNGAFNPIIKVKNNGIIKLNGAWSSRCGIMNKFFPHSILVYMSEDKKEFKNNHTTIGYITTEFAKQILNKYFPKYELKAEEIYGEIEYKIVRKVR